MGFEDYIFSLIDVDLDRSLDRKNMNRQKEVSLACV